MGTLWTCVLVGAIAAVLIELCWIDVKLGYLSEMKDVLIKIGDTLEAIQENTRRHS